ncbi:hypothetical protein [Nocardiopsis rhodophaea]|uniref:hypothetical protein n=1 Tax=Nocardiopsis rhodophaea TaxID=280238 RepID=UPI0031D1F237
MTDPGPLRTYEVQLPSGYRTRLQLTDVEARNRGLLDPADTDDGAVKNKMRTTKHK